MKLSENEWKGHLAVAKVDLRAAEKGIVSSEPKIPCRYDRILDIDGKLKRVQVKYAGQSATKANGVALCRVKKLVDRKGHRKGYDSDEVDAILLYLPQVDKICWFDPEDFVGRTELSVRYEPAKNGQTKGCVMLADKEW
jgi:hypothetical protein